MFGSISYVLLQQQILENIFLGNRRYKIYVSWCQFFCISLILEFLESPSYPSKKRIYHLYFLWGFYFIRFHHTPITKQICVHTRVSFFKMFSLFSYIQNNNVCYSVICRIGTASLEWDVIIFVLGLLFLLEIFSKECKRIRYFSVFLFNFSFHEYNCLACHEKVYGNLSLTS